MQKITPHLWFDKEAVEAANFYASVFPNSQVTHTSVLKNTPSGDCDIVAFNVMGYEFMAISAGPYFKVNPSISFMVNFDPSRDKDAAGRIDEIWGKLMDGGKALMEIGEYPFSKRYGWVQDKYGVSWQLILANPEGEERPSIIPSLLFVGDVCGKAEEAANFYGSVFKDAKVGQMVKYPAGREPDKEGTVMFGEVMLEGQWFAVMDSAHAHDFKFNEGVSLLIKAKDQEEIDYYWSKLSAVPESEQCGWLKDRFGVSWQVSPADLDKYLSQGSPEQAQRVTQAFLKMKKFDLAALKDAYEGK
jgi:predicted 3-demethylubiquinone-9 3-methyltransferase (glyoxalase superfamily)